MACASRSKWGNLVESAYFPAVNFLALLPSIFIDRLGLGTFSYLVLLMQKSTEETTAFGGGKKR